MGSSHYLEDGLPVDGSVVGIISMFGSTVPPWVLKQITKNRGFARVLELDPNYSGFCQGLLNLSILGGTKTMQPCMIIFLRDFPGTIIAHCWGPGVI